MAGLLVVLFLTFQFTKVEMQSNDGLISKDVSSLTGDTFNWKTADLMAKSIPDNINEVVKNNDIIDKTIKVFAEISEI